MQIDLVEAEAAVERLKLTQGIPDHASCIDIILWKFSSGSRELRVRITVFDGLNRCQQGEGPTWENALERVRVSFNAQGVDPGREPIEVLAPDKSEDDKQL